MKSLKVLFSENIAKISPKLFFSIAYLHNRGKFPNFKKPSDLSEIWISRVLSGDCNKLYKLADKYAVREYVKEKGLKDILVPLLGVWESPEDIDFATLPNQFALKINFGAGMNIICMDKSKLNIIEAKEKLSNWLKINTYSNSERHYNLIDRKIICEEFIHDGHNGFPYDYKFICIHGKAFCVLACEGRESLHADYMPYSMDWKPLVDYKKGDIPAPITKPPHFEKMKYIAEQLSQGIDLVRVDLYDSDKGIVFGEMTLTPAGCIFHRWTQKALDDMGKFYLKFKDKGN